MTFRDIRCIMANIFGLCFLVSTGFAFYRIATQGYAKFVEPDSVILWTEIGLIAFFGVVMIEWTVESILRAIFTKRVKVVGKPLPYDP